MIASVVNAPNKKAANVIGTIHAKIILAFSVTFAAINYKNEN